VIEAEAERLAVRCSSLRQTYQSWLRQPCMHRLRREELVLKVCPVDVAKIIHERFHYIGAYHEGIAHLGLYVVGCEEIPIALASIAPMDLHVLDSLFPTTVEKEKALVLSRVFAFDWAPRNTVSYLLSLVAHWIKTNFYQVQTLFTFLNPNLGFSGSSFRAANWRAFIEVKPTASYLDGEYITFRRFGSLSSSSRSRVERCPYELQPLRLLRYDLKRSTRRG